MCEKTDNRIEQLERELRAANERAQAYEIALNIIDSTECHALSAAKIYARAALAGR